MGTAKEFVEKRKRRVKTYDINLLVTTNDLGVLKSALKAYAETAAKKEKAIAENLLDLIEYQENK